MEDMERLILLAAMMTSESPVFVRHPFSVGKARDLITALIPTGGLIVACQRGEVIGFFAGIISEHWLSFDTYATDIGIYVLPEHRGSTAFPRLIHAFESWAIEKGAQELHLGVSTGIHPEQTVRMFERLKYTMSSYGLVKTEI